MSIKVLAVGNRLMSDDGIAVFSAETLKDVLKSKGVEVIIAETDFEYALDKICEGDFVIIMDASFCGRKPGTVIMIPMEIYLREVTYKSSYTMHQCNILNTLGFYEPGIKGFILSIEGVKFELGTELSNILKNNFGEITGEIENNIYNLIEALKIE